MFLHIHVVEYGVSVDVKLLLVYSTRGSHCYLHVYRNLNATYSGESIGGKNEFSMVRTEAIPTHALPVEDMCRQCSAVFISLRTTSYHPLHIPISARPSHRSQSLV